MNSSIQKFDIGAMMEEKLDELVTVRGMSRTDALALIDQAIREWRGVEQGTVSGTKMKAYVDLRTHKISREAARQPEAHECEFEDVTAAAIYVAELERPLLERMREGRLGDK